MLKRSTLSTPLTLLLALAVLFSSWPASDAHERAPDPAPSHAQATRLAADAHSVYLPLLRTAFGPPDVLITSPTDDLSVGGTSFFAVQAVTPGSVSSVNFKAGATDLGTDTTPDDGFQVYLDASKLPAGPAQLTATATGPGGTKTKTVNVTIVSKPPASAAVGANGTTLGTAASSTIVVPRGAATGATVSVQDKTQQQVTQEQGIQWDALGVTFLGAIDVQSSAPIDKPVGVSSVGYGNRIQPGQAVVTYQILPPAPGDTAGELVVVNGANLAPNGTIVSSPVPQIVVNSITAQAASGATSTTLSGPPGTILTIRGSGFNPASANGNVAVFHSLVDGTTLASPGFVTADSPNGTTQTFTTLIPSLAAGAATLTLHNDSTGSTAEPLPITVVAAASLSRPASDLIDSYLAQSIHFLQTFPASTPQEEAQRTSAITRYSELQVRFQQLRNDSSAPVQQFLTDFAAVIDGSGILNQLPSNSSFSTGHVTGCLPKVTKFLLGVGIILLGVGAAFACTLLTGPAAPIVCGQLVAALFGIGGLVLGIFVPTCPDTPPAACSPSQAAGGVGAPKQLVLTDERLAALPAQSGTSATTGMSSAPSPGGNACGSSLGDVFGGFLSTQGVRLSALAPGRYIVKVYPRGGGAPLTPFTGASDPGGYFFIPLIPAGQPFTAVATDTTNGARRTFQGVGPPVGQSVLMNFDFTSDGGPLTGYSTPVPAPANAVAGSFGQKLSMTLDANDDPLLAYVWTDPNNTGNYSESTLYFAHWDRPNRRWATPVTVDTLTPVYDPAGTDQVSLARDPSSGRLGIAYASETGGRHIWLAQSADNGATWTKEQAEQPSSAAPRYPVLAIGNGVVDLAYWDDSSRVWYASRNGPSGSFSYTQAPLLPNTSAAVGTSIGLALDGNGQPGLAYMLQKPDPVTAELVTTLAFWRPGSPGASAVTNSTTDVNYPQFLPSAVSLAFAGTQPRVACHLRRVGPVADRLQLWFSASSDGVNWNAPVRLSNTTQSFQSLALDGQGHAAVAADAFNRSDPACDGPLLIRSSDLVDWTGCSPEQFTLLQSAGDYINAHFTGAGKLYLAFQFRGNAELGAGVMLWREP